MWRGITSRARAARHARADPPHDRRVPPGTLSRGRRPISASALAAGRRHGQAAWFKSYMPSERPAEFDRIVQSGIPPTRPPSSAPTRTLPRMRGREGRGCTSWGIKGKDLYLLHVLRRRMEYTELKRAVREQCEAFAASVVLIEDKASGTQLIQELVADGLHAVTRYQPQTDKVMRMHAQTAMIENGLVYLPKEAAWLAEYLHELTGFPRGKHDDQVDSTAQLLDWFKRAGREPQDWLWQQYKQALARGPEPARSEPLSVMAKRLGIFRPL